MEELSRQKLAAADPEFCRLVEEHRSRDARLRELSVVPYPSSDQQIEEMRLKKEKLRLREQMELRSLRMMQANPRLMN